VWIGVDEEEVDDAMCARSFTAAKRLLNAEFIILAFVMTGGGFLLRGGEDRRPFV